MSFALTENAVHFNPENERVHKGCFVTRSRAVLLFGALLLSFVIIGVTVHYLSPDRGQHCLHDEQSQGGATVAAETTASPSSAGTPKSIRLPRHLLPIHYSLKLFPDFYGNDTSLFHFDGQVKIQMECKESTSTVTLHSKQLTLDGGGGRVTALQSTDPGSWTITGWSKNEEEELLTLTLDPPLVAGKTFQLELNFTGKLKDDLKGIYWSSYVEGNVTRRLMTSQMEPTDARKVLPCFDEPNFKATFDVIIVRNKNMTSLSNMGLNHSIPISGDLVEDHFLRTPVPMSSYLLAFTVCTDFEYVQNFTRSGTRFRVYARREVISNARYALEIGIKIQEFFEEYFNISYPLSKQDMLAVPDFASGAMENWGLIIYRETALLYDPRSSSLANKIRVATVIAHELAHQWFGNLVSPDWWDDLWLNEGFASYFEYVGVDFAEKEWGFMNHFLTDELQSVLCLDSLDSSHPVFFEIHSVDDINSVFDSITYSKGASIVRMMQNFLGENTFRSGLTRYLNRHRLSNANHNDLWSALNEESSVDGTSGALNVSSVMSGWLKQAGYPVLSIRLPEQTGKQTIKVTQRRFLIDRNSSSVENEEREDDFSWTVPFTFTFSTQLNWTNPSFQWISGRETSVPVSVDLLRNESVGMWVIGNIGQFGYYRVNYDTKNWMNLIDQLKTNHKLIPVKNRAQIIDDAFQLARAGLVDEVTGFRTTQYLHLETEVVPWRTAMTNVLSIAALLDRSPGYGHLEEYILKRLTPLYDQLGWEERRNDSANRKLLRSEVIRWTCFFGHRRCLDTASGLYGQWMQSALMMIPGDVRETVLCHGIGEGGRREWDFAFDRYQQETKADEVNRLLNALSCARAPWILTRYLNYTWEKIRKQDAPYAFAYIAKNPVGRYLAWRFFVSQWKNIEDRYGSGVFLLSHMIRSVTAAFNTHDDLHQLMAFVNSASTDLGVASKTYDQAIEKTRLNIEWMARNEEKLSQWLLADNRRL